MSTSEQFAAPAGPSASPEAPSSALAVQQDSAVATAAPDPSAVVGPRGATRSVIVVWLLLPLVTLGIYSLVWHYKVNRELRDFHPSIKVDPTLALLALFVPIAGWVSVYNTGRRIAQAEQLTGAEPSCSGGLGIVGCFFFGLHAIYYQSHLNRVWAS